MKQNLRVNFRCFAVWLEGWFFIFSSTFQKNFLNDVPLLLLLDDYTRLHIVSASLTLCTDANIYMYIYIPLCKYKMCMRRVSLSATWKRDVLAAFTYNIFLGLFSLAYLQNLSFPAALDLRYVHESSQHPRLTHATTNICWRKRCSVYINIDYTV